MAAAPAEVAAVAPGGRRGVLPWSVCSHHSVTGTGGCDCAATMLSSELRSTMTAGAVPPADGNARIAVTSRTGTVAFPTGSGTTWPTRAFAVPRNARVAMAGNGRAGYPAVSASCPATGKGPGAPFSMRTPAPTLNVSEAVPARHAVTVGLIPDAC